MSGGVTLVILAIITVVLCFYDNGRTTKKQKDREL